MDMEGTEDMRGEEMWKVSGGWWGQGWETSGIRGLVRMSWMEQIESRSRMGRFWNLYGYSEGQDLWVAKVGQRTRLLERRSRKWEVTVRKDPPHGFGNHQALWQETHVRQTMSLVPASSKSAGEWLWPTDDCNEEEKLLMPRFQEDGAVLGRRKLKLISSSKEEQTRPLHFLWILWKWVVWESPIEQSAIEPQMRLQSSQLWWEQWTHPGWY